MNARSQFEISPLQAEVRSQGWAARIDLAACIRLVVDSGGDDLVFAHVSARVPGMALRQWRERADSSCRN